MGLRPSRLFEVVTRFSGVLQSLDEMGIRVQIGDDFQDYRAHRVAQRDRGAIYPMFDPASSYVDETNGFWICGFGPDGDLIHTQAVRRLDLTGISLKTHLDRHRQKYITPDTTPDPDSTFFSGPDALNSITGTVAYQGDFWLRAKGLAGPRSHGTTALLSRLLLEVTIASWDPDYLFAFVPKALAAKGAHLRYGYTHCEAGRWIGPDQQVTDEDYLIWMNSQDLAVFSAQDIETQKRPPKTSERADPITAAQLAALDPIANA
mmetsp:Transcript_29641/g.58627  ORF Transcript_29641/g.58627 Transcript_29641/m.58627 type:complete len:262 (-) Transcript_29641:1737-2522(-)